MRPDQAGIAGLEPATYGFLPTKTLPEPRRYLALEALVDSHDVGVGYVGLGAAWHSLVVAGMHMFAALHRDLRNAFDVTLLDHGILLMLRDSPDGLTMGHLADQFGTEASVITQAGEKLCDRMGPMHVESVRAHFLNHVPRRDLPAVGDAFDHLYAAQHRAPTSEGPP